MRKGLVTALPAASGSENGAAGPLTLPRVRARDGVKLAGSNELRV